MRSTSSIWKPTVKHGLRLDIGSWKIIAMSLPMILRRSAAAHAEQVAAGEEQLVGRDRRRPRQQAHHGEHRYRLAGAGLADDCQHLALLDVQRHAIDSAERPDAV